MGICAIHARHTIQECCGCGMTSLSGNGREREEQQEAWYDAELSPYSAHQFCHWLCAFCPSMPSAIPATCETPADSHPWPEMILALPAFSFLCSTAWSYSCTEPSWLSVAAYHCPSFACIPIPQLKIVFLAHLLTASFQHKTSQYRTSPLSKQVKVPWTRKRAVGKQHNDFR